MHLKARVHPSRWATQSPWFGDRFRLSLPWRILPDGLHSTCSSAHMPLKLIRTQLHYSSHVELPWAAGTGGWAWICMSTRKSGDNAAMHPWRSHIPICTSSWSAPPCPLPYTRVLPLPRFMPNTSPSSKHWTGCMWEGADAFLRLRKMPAHQFTWELWIFG